MKKLLTAISFAAGAVFAMLFTSKKGDDVRQKMNSKKTTEAKAEVVAEEAKEVAKNFWNTIRGPLTKAGNALRKQAEHYAKEYGSEAKGKLDQWKKMAEKEIARDMKGATKELKKVAKKATATAKKQMKNLKKKVS